MLYHARPVSSIAVLKFLGQTRPPPDSERSAMAISSFAAWRSPGRLSCVSEIFRVQSP